MSTVKSKVLKVEHAGEWNTRDGDTMQKWNVVTEAGDAGTVNTKKNEAPWQVGEEAEYEVVKKEYNGTTYTTLKKAYAPGPGGGGQRRTWTPDPERENRKERIARQLLIIRQSSVNAANELIRTGSGAATLEVLMATAMAIEKHVLRGNILSRMAEAGEQAHSAAAPTAPIAAPAAPPPAAPSQTPTSGTTLDAAAEYAKAKAAPNVEQGQPVAVSPLGEDDLPF